MQRDASHCRSVTASDIRLSPQKKPSFPLTPSSSSPSPEYPHVLIGRMPTHRAFGLVRRHDGICALLTSAEVPARDEDV